MTLWPGSLKSWRRQRLNVRAFTESFAVQLSSSGVAPSLRYIIELSLLVFLVHIAILRFANVKGVAWRTPRTDL